MEDNARKPHCDTNCCVRSIVLLYEGEEFRDYLEHHVSNYQLYKPDVSITLQELPSSSVNSGGSISEGEYLIEQINDISSSSSWDGMIFPAQMTGALQESNRLWDWNEYLLQQRRSENNNNNEDDDDNINISQHCQYM